ncbi:MAG TPA: hypothetical protein VIM26_00460 [Pengzhenrongella sp.]
MLATLGGASWIGTGGPGVPHYVLSSIETRLAPAPSAEVVELADKAHLTDEGRNLFYGTRPQVLGVKAFAGKCVDSQRATSGSGAVGCFRERANSIVLYEPADPRLRGFVVEAAAHEMLHAAWARMSAAEQARLTPLLEAEIVSLAPDDPIRGRISASVGTHPESRPTELFAYVGTTLWRAGGLAPQLEAAYARVISERAALVAVHTGAEALFEAKGAEITAALRVLGPREAKNAQRHAQYDADVSAAGRDRQSYQTEAAEIAAMPPSQRASTQLSIVWSDGTRLPMAQAETTLAAAAALLARDEAALPARATALHADEASATAERAHVSGLRADLRALEAQLDPAGPAS